MTTRLLPWLVSPVVPRSVAWIFAKSLITATLEVAFVVGWVTGWALECAAEVAGGEARVRELLGLSPQQSAARLAVWAIPLALLVLGCSFLAGRDASAPGAIVNGLIHEARDACLAGEKPRMVEVPFANASWLCTTGERPLLFMTVRTMPVAAREATVGPDLSRASLREVYALAGPASVTAREVEVRGLRAWTLPSPLSPLRRAASIAGGAALASLGIAALFFRRRIRARGSALGAGLSASAALFLVLRSLERIPIPPRWVPDVGTVLLLIAPISAAILFTAASRLFSRRLPWPRRTATS